jgi:hypothetical protein
MYLELLSAARPDSSLRETQREIGPPYLEDIYLYALYDKKYAKSYAKSYVKYVFKFA